MIALTNTSRIISERALRRRSRAWAGLLLRQLERMGLRREALKLMGTRAAALLLDAARYPHMTQRQLGMFHGISASRVQQFLGKAERACVRRIRREGSSSMAMLARACPWLTTFHFFWLMADQTSNKEIK